jgi:uncharacterized protein YegL
MNENLTEIIFLIDRSGSMSGLESDTIGGFNGFIEKQCKLEGEILLTTVLFDNEYEVLWQGENPNDVKLTNKEYYVRGSTALLDAVGKTITAVDHRLTQTRDEEKPGKVFFVITTDGYENASQEYTHEKIKELIKQKQENCLWEFIFMGANLDVAKEAESIGISEEQAYEFQATEKGVKQMYENLNRTVLEKRNK